MLIGKKKKKSMRRDTIEERGEYRIRKKKRKIDRKLEKTKLII